MISSITFYFIFLYIIYFNFRSLYFPADGVAPVSDEGSASPLTASERERIAIKATLLLNQKKYLESGKIFGYLLEACPDAPLKVCWFV